MTGAVGAVSPRPAASTVATTTDDGILWSRPLIGGLSPTHLALLALAAGAGPPFLSHVNDAGFRLVDQMFRLLVGQRFQDLVGDGDADGGGLRPPADPVGDFLDSRARGWA